MAAIAYPTPHPRQVELRPSLRVVRGVPRPSDAVYRRRRLVAGVLVATVVVILISGVAVLLSWRGADSAATTLRTQTPTGAIVSDPAAYGAAHEAPPPGSVYVVQPGDTLWSIAHELAPDGDVRAAVDRLVDLNGTAALQVGQRLTLAPSDGS
jgi:LysM repeat protein